MFLKNLLIAIKMKNTIKTNNNFIKSNTEFNSENVVQIKDLTFNSNEELHLELAQHNMFTIFEFIHCNFINIDLSKLIISNISFCQCNFEKCDLSELFFVSNYILESYFKNNTLCKTENNFLKFITSFVFSNYVSRGIEQ